MSTIHNFRCDSCKIEVKADYNGEHYLPPKGWVELTDVVPLKKFGHLCTVCRDTAFSVNLRATPAGKRILKNQK